jgi:salicylate biosynthesis isochorismate synthase
VSTPNRRAGPLDASDRAGIAEAVHAAQSSGQTQWVARVADAESIDALGCYARCRASDRFLWERSEAGSHYVAWGCIDEIETAGAARFRDVAAWSDRVRARLHWLGCARPRTGPVLFGGFGFEDDTAPASEWKAFPAARFILPNTIGEIDAGQCRWITLARVEPGADAVGVEQELVRRQREAEAISRGDPLERSDAETAPSDLHAIADWPAGPEYRVRSDRAHAVFMAQVGRALADIESGELDKIVLARSLQVDHDGPLDIAGFLARLRGLYPSCTLISVGRGEDTFLAATPESLVRVRGDRIETAALAGSARRGRTPEEDAALAQGLRASDKERAEHAHVVEAIRRVLEPHCAELEFSDTPALRGLFGIQHLETCFSGRLRAGDVDQPQNQVLGFVEALHPTPAVGGVPKARARDWLHRFERLDRGWYASPVGWLDAEGGGDFCVALRSGLIRQGLSELRDGHSSRAWLYAGAGIVPGSDPEQELVETRVKLRALLAPLTEI